MAESRKPVISVHDLAKNYGELKVLRKIDMDIYKGEVVSVIGPSGSGKSTFLRCLNYLEELTSGEIDIGGVSLKGIDEDKHNKHLMIDVSEYGTDLTAEMICFAARKMFED